MKLDEHASHAMPSAALRATALAVVGTLCALKDHAEGTGPSWACTVISMLHRRQCMQQAAMLQHQHLLNALDAGVICRGEHGGRTADPGRGAVPGGCTARGLQLTGRSRAHEQPERLASPGHTGEGRHF